MEALPRFEAAPSKKPKGKVRKEKEIEEFVVKRKLTAPNPEVQPLSEDIDDRLFLTDEIVNLKKRQAERQSDFARRVEDEITDFSRRASMQIHAIKYANYWKEPEYEFIKVQKASKQAGESSGSRLGFSDMADSPVRFRNK